MNLLNIIAQVVIFFTGATSIFLVSRTDSWKRWGYIVGLSAQPFWYIVTLSSHQYIIFVMCLFYTYSWGLGVWNYWIKPTLKKNE